MDGFVIAGCGAIFSFFAVIAWLFYRKKRHPPTRNSMVIAESLQPQIICKSVPCQHPYYRVISEYSGQDASQEFRSSDEKAENNASKGLKKFDYEEWSRRLSLNSISRKSTHPDSNSRRTSTSEVGWVHTQCSKTKPYIAA